MRTRAVAALMLAAATAGFVWWRNSQVADLLDLSYVLDFSFRIARGELPYRDYPFVHAPLTFVIQAAIIAAAGRHYLYQIAYACLAGAAATVLTWRLLQQDLGRLLPSPALAAFALSMPLVCLGVYSIIPHPFYDSDTTIAILLVTLAAWAAERKHFPTAATFGAGALFVLPVFGKQNTGLAFLGAAVAGLGLLTVVEWRVQEARRGYLLLLAGAAAGLLASVLAVHFIVGLGNYVRWTVQFAAERRLPPLADMVGIYRDARLGWWLASAVLAWTVATLAPGRSHRTPAILVVVLVCLPFVYLLVAAVRSKDFWDFADRFLSLWPYLLVSSALAALAEFRVRSGLARIWPFVLLAAIHGCLMSQQVWGSTYGIWPLFVLLLATVLSAAMRPLAAEAPRALAVAAFVAGLSLAYGGWSYTVSNERLSPANVFDGQLAGSNVPALSGLRTRGRWLPDFDELVAWSAQNIPFEDGIILLPGEDPFFYATGRLPRFPVLLFDETGNPYSPGEYLQIARSYGIRWLVVKKVTQARDTMYDESFAITELAAEFKPVAELRNYRVYRR